MLKDHLGNVRMVLTDEQRTIYYPAATLEGTFSASDPQASSMVNFEKRFYKIDQNKIVSEPWTGETLANTRLYYNNNDGNPPSNLSYPSGTTPVQTDNSEKMYKLNATSNHTGLDFVIKVMAGDKIDIFGKSYYQNTGTINNSNSTALDLASIFLSLLGAPGNEMAGKGVTAGDLSSLNSGLIPASFIRGANGETTTIPKASVNYGFFDEQFRYAGGVGVITDHWTNDANLRDITVPKNGYLYVYVSNESNVDVFFDNLQVVHKPGPILEETHYYPFGLTMAGISSKALSFGGPENWRGYNGNDIQQNEFGDGSGLDLYDFNARTYSQQVGRFIQMDPLVNEGGQESMTPYQFGWNDPIKNADPDGKCPSCLIGFFVGVVVDATIQVSTSIVKSIAIGETPTLATIGRDFQYRQTFAAGAAGFVTGGISAYEQGTAAMAKGVLANATFGAMEQVRTTGSVNLVNLGIEAFPLPEIKLNPAINLSTAEKGVREAENSIASSTSTVPQRKFDRLSEAQSNLTRQKYVNEGVKSTVTSSAEGSSKNLIKGFNDVTPSTPAAMVPVTMPRFDTRPINDNMRVAKPVIPLEFR